MKKLTLLCLFLGMAAPGIFAGIADPNPVTITQPDGSYFFAHMKGDEHQHWVETIDGYTIIKNQKNQRWEYARQSKQGRLEPSGIAVSEQTKPPKGLMKSIRPERDWLSQELAMKDSVGKAGEWEPTLISGTRRLLFIAVNFSDRQLVTSTQDWANAIFDETPGVKSVANFYKDNSRGQIQPTPAPNNQGGSIVEVTINTRHPNTGLANLAPTRKYRIETGWINDALEAATQYVDFVALDTNGDGDLTLDEAVVYFIVAGYDASSGSNEPNVWGHKWSTWNAGDVMAGSIQVNRWALNGELYNSGDRHPIGIITHELGHLMCALPDLYDIENVNAGMGIFSLMAAGSWGTAAADTLPGSTPVNMDAWCRYVIGWSAPRTPNPGDTVSFGSPLAQVDAPVILKDSNLNGNEYFMVENRPPESWDLGMEVTLTSPVSSLTEGGNSLPSAPLTYSPVGSVTATAINCGLGNPADFPAAVSGQIALIARGDLSFVDKVNNAKAAGALAAIIYNNTTGLLQGTLGGPGDYIPAVGILQADGPGLAGKTVTLDLRTPAWTGGLLIQHIDETVGTRASNDINASSNAHQGVVIEEADPSVGTLTDANNLSSGSALHLYSSATQDAFSPNTTPNSDYYDGSMSGLAITNISAPGASMTATVNGGSVPNPIAPAAGFSFAVSGLQADFSDSSSDADGLILAWAWDFGDGNGSTAQNPSHSYAAAGTYSVTLTVTDNDGLSDSHTQTVSVSDPASTVTDTFSGTLAGKQVQSFPITVSGGLIQLNLDWDNNNGLDLFLRDSNGTLVASNTSGSNPKSLAYQTGGAAGTYTIEIENTAKSPRASANFNLSATYEP